MNSTRRGTTLDLDVYSGNWPGHSERLADHERRVQLEDHGDNGNVRLTTIDDDLGIPWQAADVLRVRMFETAYKTLAHEKDLAVRFASAIVLSARPVSREAAREWYETDWDEEAKKDAEHEHHHADKKY